MQLPQSWTLNQNWKGIFRGSTLHIYSWHYTQEGPTLNELAILQCLPCTLSLAYTEFVLSQPHHVCIFMLLHALLCEFAIAMKIELIEWARSWVQPQHCKSKTTNTTTQRRTHKAFPKSQLMSSPSLVPPYFTLSLYIIPTVPVTATSQREAQCSLILVFPLPGSSQHRGLQMTLYEYEWTVILF